MSEIILQFSTSTEWSSAIIRRLCHSDFSHVDWVLPAGLYGASDPGGVMLRPFNYQKFGVRHNARVEATSGQIRLFGEFCYAQEGKPFDNDALWSFIGGHREKQAWKEPDKWLCSEMIACAFDYAGWY